MKSGEAPTEEQVFVLFRRKVREAEVLSASMERLLQALRFTGRVSVVVQNGRILKSGYEEGYFRSRSPRDSTLAEEVRERAQEPQLSGLLLTTSK